MMIFDAISRLVVTIALAAIALGMLWWLASCASQRHLDDDRNMATMPFDKLIIELSKP